MSLLQGFARVGAEKPRILILGSFPSEKSLERGEYYGNGRNHFWPLLGGILGFSPTEPYTDRLARLERAGIALWDLIASCEREGSLDQDIREELPNPLSEYIGSSPSIERLGLNGGKAAASFVAHVAPDLRRGTESGPAFRLAIGGTESWSPDFAPERVILVARLPSASPVPSGRFRGAEDKLPAWSAFLAASIRPRPEARRDAGRLGRADPRVREPESRDPPLVGLEELPFHDGHVPDGLPRDREELPGLHDGGGH